MQDSAHRRVRIASDFDRAAMAFSHPLPSFLDPLVAMQAQNYQIISPRPISGENAFREVSVSCCYAEGLTR